MSNSFDSFGRRDHIEYPEASPDDLTRRGVAEDPAVVRAIEDAVERIRRGEMIIVVDDDTRENEGDLIFAARHATQEMINFLLKHARGMICVPASLERLEELNIDRMVPTNTSRLETNYFVTVDHRDTTTGISAAERALTIRELANPRSRPEDFLRPGHINPLGALPGGVLRRAGHTEATVDLVRMAKLEPVGVLCEVLNDDGTMARLPQLQELSKKTGIPIISIADLISYRRHREKLVKKVVTTRLPNEFGTWTLHLYESLLTKEEHVLMVFGEPEKQESALVRVHSKCLTGDVLGSRRCDCGAQLHAAMSQIAREGHGILLYLDQEGRGIGLRNKLRAYALQDQGKDTVEANIALGLPADQREYGIGAQILADYGLHKIRILTNNPRKMVGIAGFGLEVVERVPLEVGQTRENEKYLSTKASKLGHMLGHPEDITPDDAQRALDRAPVK